MHGADDPLDGAPHFATYWIPFWDEPVVVDCTCDLSADHLEKTPILGAETAAALLRRIHAWFRKEPRP